MSWTNDIETLLDNIRINSIFMSEHHKKRYVELKKTLRFFKIPIIVISSFNSVFSIGSQLYMKQSDISLISCILSLFCSVIGAIELYLQINTQMESELISSKEYYILSININKVLQLRPENRVITGQLFLDTQYQTYVKLIESSNILTSKIKDQLTIIKPEIIQNSIKINSANSSASNSLSSVDFDVIL